MLLKPNQSLFNIKGTESFLPSTLLIAAILIAAFFTYDQYYLLTAKREELRQAENEKTSLGQTLSDLGKLKTQASVPAFAEEISRYASPFREDAVLASLFEKNSGILILSVGMKKGEKLPNGLSMADITVSLRTTSQQALLKYLDALTGITGKKRYVVKQIAFPFDSASASNGPIQVNLSLGLYHSSK
jgi:hypothetical protein